MYLYNTKKGETQILCNKVIKTVPGFHLADPVQSAHVPGEMTG